MLWSVPREWGGERVFILGGGPSLSHAPLAALRGAGRVIAINDAFLLAPQADVHYFADARWFEWNRSDLSVFAGRYRVTRAEIVAPGLDVRRLRHDRRRDYSTDPGVLAGYCSGANAINLAALFGARDIILLGFDMRPGNWHDRHKTPPRPTHHRDKFIPSIERMAPHLAAAGVRVTNATPGSALTCFPIASPDEVLGA